MANVWSVSMDFVRGPCEAVGVSGGSQQFILETYFSALILSHCAVAHHPSLLLRTRARALNASSTHLNWEAVAASRPLVRIRSRSSPVRRRPHARSTPLAVAAHEPDSRDASPAGARRGPTVAARRQFRRACHLVVPRRLRRSFARQPMVSSW